METGTFTRNIFPHIFYTFYILLHLYATTMILWITSVHYFPVEARALWICKAIFHAIALLLTGMLLTSSALHSYYKGVASFLVLEFIFSLVVYSTWFELLSVILHLMTVVIATPLFIDPKSPMLAELRPFKFQSAIAMMPPYGMPMSPMPPVMYAYPPPSPHYVPYSPVYPAPGTPPIAAAMPVQPPLSPPHQ